MSIYGDAVQLPRQHALLVSLLRLALPLAAALALAVPAHAQSEPTAPVYDSQDRLIETPFVPSTDVTRLDEESATELALTHPKVEDWVSRFDQAELVTRARYESGRNQWEVKVWAGDRAGQIALAQVADSSGDVVEAWTGPQVNWTMARGRDGAFGRKVNAPEIWFGFCALFLVGLLDFRRLRSVRNLDLLVLVSFSASLWFFNHGEIFTSVPLAYPPLVYLLGRMLWIVRARDGAREHTARRVIWPTWLLIGAAVLTLGFRVGLNLESSNVIDVGYAGVIGAHRIVEEGRSPYGNFPVREGEECGEADVSGTVRDRIQDNGRCESSNTRGDTYGPVTYLAYVPGYLALGWTGLWDSLPAAHFTSLVVDLLAIMGLVLIGWRYGRARLAAILASAWVAFPFTQYVSSTNANDTLVPAFLILGFWAATSAPARGLFLGLASWTKFAPLLLAPLWLGYPRALSVTRLKNPALFIGGFLAASALGFWVLLLEPGLGGAIGTFWERTLEWQLGRDSPFSLWNWGRYNYLDLGVLQRVLQGLVIAGAIVAAFFPRKRSLVTLAALTAALVIALELTMTHWFYLYVVWFFPFVLLALFLDGRIESERPAESLPGDSAAGSDGQAERLAV